MFRKVLTTTFLATSLALSPVAFANCTGGCGGGCGSGCASDCCADACGGSVTCPSCNKVCELEVKEVKESKSCFKIETKEICIPRVVFPWQKNCCDPSVNNGACVLTIKTLSTHKYECPACSYSWTPTEGCVSCCDDGCGSGCGGCTSGGCTGGCVATKKATSKGLAGRVASRKRFHGVAEDKVATHVAQKSTASKAKLPARVIPARQKSAVQKKPEQVRFANYLSMPNLRRLVK